MLLVHHGMYSYVIRIYSYNHPCVLVCHPYVAPMHWHVIRMPSVCTRASFDITLIYTYAIRMLLACGFTMNHLRVFVKQMTILYGVRFMVKHIRVTCGWDTSTYKWHYGWHTSDERDKGTFMSLACHSYILTCMSPFCQSYAICMSLVCGFTTSPP